MLWPIGVIDECRPESIDHWCRPRAYTCEVGRIAGDFANGPDVSDVQGVNP